MPEETAAAAETVENAATEQQVTGQPTATPVEQTEAGATEQSATAEPEEISYHAVEKEGKVTAIWEMQGRKHLRTIDPRSGEGKHILELFTSEHHEEAA